MSGPIKIGYSQSKGKAAEREVIQAVFIGLLGCLSFAVRDVLETLVFIMGI